MENNQQKRGPIGTFPYRKSGNIVAFCHAIKQYEKWVFKNNYGAEKSLNIEMQWLPLLHQFVSQACSRKMNFQKLDS